MHPVAMRVRFAPSPTGALHIGGARTALYNWLLARGQPAATLVLRIEDTDRERSTPENVEQILDALRLARDRLRRGPDLPVRARRAPRRGARAAARRRPRLPLHRRARRGQGVQGRSTANRGFRGDRRGRGRRAPAGARRGRDRRARRHPRRERVRARAPRRPGDRPRRRHALYNFAVVVDDLDAGITHVVRGADHYSNTPKQMLVLEALGRRAAGLRAPAAAARARRQEALQAPRRRVRAGAARRRLPARGGAQLPRAARLGRTTTRRPSHDRGAPASASRSSASRKTPRCFDEQKLRWMNGRYLRELDRRGPHRAPRGASPGRTGLRDAVEITQEKISDAGRVLAAGGLLLRRPGRRPGGAREGARRRGRARALADGARRRSPTLREPWTRRGVEAALRGVVEARGVKPQAGLPAGARRARRHDRLAGDLRDRGAARRATRRCADRRALARRRGVSGSSGTIRPLSADRPIRDEGAPTGLQTLQPLTVRYSHEPRHRDRAVRRGPEPGSRAARVVGRRHNEGHGKRLTAAFDALERFPALAESRNRLLEPGRRGAPLDRRRRRRHRVRRRARDRRPAPRQQASRARAAARSRASSSAVEVLSPEAVQAPRRHRRDLRVLRARQDLGRRARALPPARRRRPARRRPARRRRPATRTATGCSSPRCCTTSASSCSCTPTRATRSRSTARRARPRSACTTSAASSASTTRSSAACSPAAGACRRAVASAIERHHAEDADRRRRLRPPRRHARPLRAGLAGLARTSCCAPPAPSASARPSCARSSTTCPTRSSARPRAVEPCPLSGRELEVLKRLAQGMVYKQIAHELALSTSTVRTHLHNIYGKLGAVDRAQAVLSPPSAAGSRPGPG